MKRKTINIDELDFNALTEIKDETHIPLWFLVKVLLERKEMGFSAIVEDRWTEAKEKRRENWGNNTDWYIPRKRGPVRDA